MGPENRIERAIGVPGLFLGPTLSTATMGVDDIRPGGAGTPGGGGSAIVGLMDTGFMLGRLPPSRISISTSRVAAATHQRPRRRLERRARRGHPLAFSAASSIRSMAT
jgi:hypothetical protein